MDGKTVVIKETLRHVDKAVIALDNVVSSPLAIPAPRMIPEHLREFAKSLPDDCSGDVAEGVHPGLIVKLITAVGAIYDPRKGLSQRDRDWLSSAIDCCKGLGFHLSQDFQVMPLNLWDGCDFLDERFSSIPTDLLITCLVCNPRTVDEVTFCGKATMVGARDCRVSGHHNEESSWRQAVERSGAKVVVTFSDIDHPWEVRVCDLKGSNYDSGPDFTVSAISLQSGIDTRQFRMETLLRKDIAQMIGEGQAGCG